MKQTPVRNGWPIRFELNWAVMSALSIAAFGATLTGCGEGVDSSGYEVILDQPEEPPAAPSETTSVAPAEAEIVETTADVGSKQPTSSQPPTDATLAKNALEPGSQGDPQNNLQDAATPGETPADSSPPSADAIEEKEGITGKPEADSGSAKPAADETTPAPANTELKEPVKPKQPRIVKLLIPDKKFQSEGSGAEKALRVSFDDFDLLKVLNMEPVTEDAPSRMPKWLKDLDGKRIRVRGFMFPPFEDENIRAFTLARDNQICCFGRNPLVYDLVDIFIRKGESTSYIQNRPFDVVGVFHIGDSIIPGELYSMDDAVVVDR